MKIVQRPKAERTSTPKPNRVHAIEQSFLRCAVPECLNSNPYLEIHHIDGQRTTPFDHRDENLLALCRHHHGMATRGILTINECRKLKRNLKNFRPPDFTSVLERFLFLEKLHHLFGAGLFEDVEIALRLINKYLQHNKYRMDKHTLAVMKELYAEIKIQQGLPIEGLQSAKDAKRLFDDIGEPANRTHTLGLLSVISKMTHDYDESLYYLRESLSIASMIEDNSERYRKVGWIDTLNSSVFLAIRELGRTQEYIESSIDNYNRANVELLPGEKGEPLLQMANVAILAGNLDRAEQLLEQSSKIIHDTTWNTYKVKLNRTKFDFYVSSERYNDAKDSLILAWEIGSSNPYYQKHIIERVVTHPELCPEQIISFLRQSHAKCLFCNRSNIKETAQCHLEYLECYRNDLFSI